MIPDEVVIKLFDKVYTQIFLQNEDNSINIFLCGANPEKAESLRNQIYQKIKPITKLNIVFPELIFSNLLYDKQHNLLTLENELAADVDIIVLPLEGYGTVAELGAFASFEKLIKKIIVINKSKYKHNRGFINIGPIRLIRSANTKHIIYYDDNSIDSTNEMLDRIHKRLLYSRKQETKKNIKNLLTFSRFLLYIVAFFQPITEEEIKAYLKKWDPDIPEHYINPGLEILCEKDNIERDHRQDKVIYTLTSEGHNYVYEDLFRTLNILKESSKMRSEILYFQNRKIKKFDINRERGRFLVSS